MRAYFEWEPEMNRLLNVIFRENGILGNRVKLLQDSTVVTRNGEDACNRCVKGLTKDDETAVRR